MQLHKLPSLPPVFVATAEYDVLRDEDLADAEKLQAAGVSVTRLHSPAYAPQLSRTSCDCGPVPQF
jgi:acetyl esterase